MGTGKGALWGFGGSQWRYVIPSGVMGSLKGLYGVMGTLNGALWGYGVPSRVMGSLNGSLWGYGDPKWGSVGFGGSPTGFGLPYGVWGSP